MSNTKKYLQTTKKLKLTKFLCKNQYFYTYNAQCQCILNQNNMSRKMSPKQNKKYIEPVWNTYGDHNLTPEQLLAQSIKPVKDLLNEDNKIPNVSESVSKIKLKLQDIQDAHIRIKNDIFETPVVPARHIGKGFCKLFYKCENLQNTGSFKARGACNVVMSMEPSTRSKGCVVAGGRNFLYAMAHYGFKNSVPVNVVVPRTCSLTDRQRFKEEYALIKPHGNDNNDACLHALTFCNEIGAHYIHGSDRLDLMAGYGTMGLEILSQLDKLDCIICPVGTGGLLASLILAVKSLKPNCLIYGVEAACNPTMTRALSERKPVMTQPTSSLADSLSVPIVSNNAYHIARGYMDRMISVDENWLSRAIINLMEREKLLVEGAGAVSVACVMASLVPELRGKTVVCILTGGNVSSTRVSRLIDRGMAVEGRLMRVNAVIPDCPGSMMKLLAKISDAGGDVKSLLPERAWMRRDIYTVGVNILIETLDMNHAKELERKIMKDYPQSSVLMM